jgi:hypothetical protein
MKIMHRSLALLAMIVIASACGPSQKVTSSWVNPDHVVGAKKYHKIFIGALVNNATVRQHLEEDMTAAAKSKGYEVVRSIDVLGPTFTKENAPSKEAILSKVRSLGCDLIYTVTLVDKQSEQRYVPGANAYTPYPMYGNRFHGYYNYWSPYMYDPGYYTTDKTYFMEGELFDADNESMIWSVQTEAYNPSNIDSFAKKLTELMQARLEKDLDIKK